MSAPPEILQLVDRFDRNLEAYRSGQYNETQLRREFLDPLFTALGWDVENKQGYAEAYKDVIHEDAIKVGGATKAPDYCFRIGGTRKFFVEAKKPSVNLKDEISPAYQLRRYAWSAKLPLSILTDFDEFAVYDCRVKPASADAAATTRTLYLQFKEYPERWEEIASIFSREAVLKGSFDKYAESTKAKKGTAEVDDAFLKEIESWRDTLARTIALRNTELTQRQLNFAVQRTIDRMIFLRICEDRGIETYGALMALLNGEHVYKRLCELFHRADEKYNSGLFHFRLERDRLEEPDELTLGLNIDDKPLKEMIRNLYYPDSPYEFSVLPADILGQVYEQFLGKVIRLTAGHRAVVEDKPEVKKAGGVYYTPTYIVDYIVKNTVGKLLGDGYASTSSRPSGVTSLSMTGKEGERHPERSPDAVGTETKGVSRKPATPKQASKLRILDPACGSGSFLIGAYQYLLDWHRDWYINDGANKWATGRSPVLFQVTGGDWRLTTMERKRILLNNIYGVDIDPQAVEVTKLSLLLKVLEGENEQTISRQLKMFHERALPDLGSNIKCGNSLIGPDFYEGKQLSLLDEEERMRINVFDWKKEFAEVFSAGGPARRSDSGRGPARRNPPLADEGGFDAVIGNPPWGASFSDEELTYLRGAHRDIIVRMIDSYLFFIHMSLKLLHSNGLFGMIIPSTFLTQEDAQGLRRYLLQNVCLDIVVNLGERVFGPAVLNTSTILAFEVAKTSKAFQPLIVDDFRDIPPVEKASHLQGAKLIAADEWSKLVHTDVTSVYYTVDIPGVVLLQKLLETMGTFQDILDGEIQRGVTPDYLDAVVVNQKTAKQRRIEKTALRPLVLGKHISRYAPLGSSDFLIYLTRDDDIRRYPNVQSHLEEFRDRISCREVKEGKHPWYSLHRPRDASIFNPPKFIGLTTTRRICVALDTDVGYFTTDALYVFRLKKGLDLDQRFALGVLQSSCFQFLYQVNSQGEQRVIPQIKAVKLYPLPFPTLKLSDPDNKSRHDRMVEMVKEMLTLHKQLASAKTEHEKTALQRQIDATDKQIDQLVYELYGLTKEEIQIVEEKKG